MTLDRLSRLKGMETFNDALTILDGYALDRLSRLKGMETVGG